MENKIDMVINSVSGLIIESCVPNISVKEAIAIAEITKALAMLVEARTNATK